MLNKTIVAIVCITILLTVAMLKGFNGLALAGGLGLIAGLGGFAIGKTVKK